MDWQEISGSWVIIPPSPKGIIHFLGGAFVASAPQITYRWLLENFAKSGYLVIATPYINTFEHTAIARNVLNRFEQLLIKLHAQRLLSQAYLPIYGVGHSLGCKLHLLIGSLFSPERAGNIFISFNNYPVRRAIPLADQLDQSLLKNLEFKPSPTETLEIISKNYQIRRNLLIKFTNDDIDQTLNLTPILQQRFADLVVMLTLSGNHLTPLSQDIAWQTGEVFTPFDAVAQWVKQEFNRDLNQLKGEILRWLNPQLILS